MNYLSKTLRRSPSAGLNYPSLLESVQEETKFSGGLFGSRELPPLDAIDMGPSMCFSTEPNELEMESELDGGLIYPPQQSTQTSTRLQHKHKSERSSLFSFNYEFYERTKSAPPRFLGYIESLKDSRKFFILEAASIAAENLIFRPDERVDLDCSIGTVNCKSFLMKIESLVSAFNIPFVDRCYRDEFSLPYRTLYAEDSLCYLTEVLDSAQEGLPFIVLNSEKYIFSSTVLTKGNELFFVFIALKELIKSAYNL
jgi:hypothetical protein